MMPLPNEYTKDDVIALKHLANLFTQPKLSVVSIGCCDGVMVDPYWRHLCWSGCEVSGHYFDANCELVSICRKNVHAHQPGIHCHCAAIWKRNEQQTYWYIPNKVLHNEMAANCELAMGCGGLGELPPAELRQEWMKPYIKTVPVECITWGKACERYAIGQFDCLNIDVEGNDIVVARQIDFRKHNIKWASIELLHCQEDAQAYAKFMHDKYHDEYVVFAGTWDLYLVRRDLPKVSVSQI